MSDRLHKKRIGDVLMERGLLRREWIPEILEFAERNGLRFGEAAIQLKKVTREQVDRILKEPYGNEFIFRLDPQYFPESTRALFPVETLMSQAILPLGTKSEFSWFKRRQRLNLGAVNAGQRDGEVRNFLKERGIQDSVRIYSVLPDEFMTILKRVYGVPSDGQSEHSLSWHESVRLYLELRT